MNIFKINNGLIKLAPLDKFFEDGICKRSFIHIYGGEETGKTRLALDIMKENPDKIFIYMDVNFNLSYDLSDNVFYLKDNNIDNLLNLIDMISKNEINVLIIDGFGNLTYNNEIMGTYDKRYEVFNKLIGKLIDKCYSKNIMLIAFNTVNGRNNATCFSKQIERQCSLNIELSVYKLSEKYIELKLTSRKNILGSNRSVRIKINDR